MSDTSPQGATNRSVDTFIRILLLGGLLAWCALIMAPFTSILLWAVILAVALFPFFKLLSRWMGGKRVLPATVVVVLGLSVIAVPGYFIGNSLLGTVSTARDHLSGEALRIPPLPADWTDGTGLRRTIADRWPKENGEIATFLTHHTGEVRTVAGYLLSALGGFTVTVLMFIMAIILAGVLLGSAAVGGEALNRFLSRALGRDGAQFVDMATATIRNVAKGILGVALIQTALLAAGLFVAGVPAAGVLSLVGLMLAIMQIGVGPVVLGVIIYAFADMETVPAVMLSIWLVITSLADNVLKPILLGRGAPVPTPVIFIGSIGGFLLSGIIGLFTGAVVLSIGYRVLLMWMDQDKDKESAASPPSA